MLTPLTREKMEQLIPLIATGKQYSYYWGKWSDVLNRLLVSVVGIVVVLILDVLFGDQGEALILLLGGIVALYWLWCPVYQASRRNAANRRFKYSGFWRGQVLDVFLTEELIGEEETVNQRGELVIIENRERWINLILGDQTGFKLEVQAPLQRIYKGIKPGQTAELLVLSNKLDLSQINKISDAFIPQRNIWVGQYPYLQRDVFLEVSRQLGGA
ncbi:MAG: phosphate ABC transporter permease, partial [Cyanobacteria bacterium P01_A01_bin.40]